VCVCVCVCVCCKKEGLRARFDRSRPLKAHATTHTNKQTLPPSHHTHKQTVPPSNHTHKRTDSASLPHTHSPSLYPSLPLSPSLPVAIALCPSHPRSQTPSSSASTRSAYNMWRVWNVAKTQLGVFRKEYKGGLIPSRAQPLHTYRHGHAPVRTKAGL
jgi:hypothetical protein